MPTINRTIRPPSTACNYCAAVICFFAAASTQIAFSQPAESEILERSVAYGTSFQNLNQEFAKNRQHYTELMERSDSIAKRLIQTNQDSQAIQSATVQNNVQAIQRYLRERELQQSLNLPRKPLGPSRIEALATAAASIDLASSQFVSLNIQQELAQLDVAQRATAERWLKLLAQYQDTMQQMNACGTEEKRLVDSYIALSDQPATRCRVELNAALHTLNAATEDNVGARMARGITYSRLGKLDEAAEQFNGLNQLPLPYSAIAIAARIEMYARDTSFKATRDEQRLLNSATDPNVLFLRARISALQGNFSESSKFSERLLKVPTHQIRALVFSSLINSHPDHKEAKATKSLEHAQLANDLSGGSDWYANIALALAYAANKQSEQALSAADKAIELSIGDMRERCRQIRNALANGQAAKWKF